MNRQVEVDRERMMWKLMGRQSVKHAQKCGGQESVVHAGSWSWMRVGRRLLVASNTVTGVAVQGDLGRRKLEERRAEMNCLVRDWKGWKES